MSVAIKPYQLTDSDLGDSGYVLARREFDNRDEALAAFNRWADIACQQGGNIRLRGPDVDMQVVKWSGSE